MQSQPSGMIGGLGRAVMLFAGALTVAVPAAAGAADDALTVEIREWTVPWEKSRPRDPAVAENGDVWFVGQGGDYLGRLDPAAETFKRHDLPDGTGPHNVVLGPEQRLWVAGNRNARIIRVFPDSGRQTSFTLPDEQGDPHTQQFGPEGYLWFTMQHYNAIGRLDVARGDFRIIRLPTPDARPYGMKIAADGMIWFTQFGTNKLARLDPEALKVREFQLPRDDGRPRRLTIDDDGGIWYVDYARGYLGHLAPESGEIREWRTPGGAKSMPYGMARDDAGRLWFVETGPSPNKLVGFDPGSESFVIETEIPSGGGAVRHMVFDEVSNSLWFGTDANTIGRAHIRR